MLDKELLKRLIYDNGLNAELSDRDIHRIVMQGKRHAVQVTSGLRLVLLGNPERRVLMVKIKEDGQSDRTTELSLWTDFGIAY